METSEEIIDRSVVIVNRILKDLTSRKGLHQAWNDIDDDIQSYIVEIWRDIVVQNLTKEQMSINAAI